MDFSELASFIDSRMQMSHIYQPVMLMTLLNNGGTCSEEQIARALLEHDISQVEYYEKITRDMVGRVLRRHEIVSRDRKSRAYALNGFGSLTPGQIGELIQKCRAKLQGFLEARGDRPWRHRKQSSGYIPGTLRYEILKAAKFHCELCGISADDKALEVDHIVPKTKGGSNDPSNLQALCYSCNAMKRDRDDTDFRAVRSSYEKREKGCLFCEIPRDRVVVANRLAYAIADAYPVTEQHSLVIVKRHVLSFFDLGRPEINASLSLLSELRMRIQRADPSVSGFNVGINDGVDAGQTIAHCHWHLIPRRAGDVTDPRGGIRNTIPGRGAY
jgi:diadenosine tetraphosphate (Ap4A) HIT family hydrolase